MRRLQCRQVSWSSFLSVQAVLVVSREPGPRSILGRFSWPQATEASRLLVRFAEAEQCLHFIPLLLLCVVCLVNSRRQRFKSRMAVPLLQFCWLVFVTQSP